MLRWLSDPPTTLLDYLPENALVLVDDMAEVSAAMADLESQAIQIEADLVREAEIPAGFHESVKPEFYESCIEVNTGVCRDVAEVGRDLLPKLTAEL